VTIGAFTDKQHQPAIDEVFESLGPTRLAWESLVEHVSAAYRVQSDFRFYGKSYGWAQRIRRCGKALLSLYPRRGGFTVQIVLPESGVQAALLRNLGPSASRAIAAANVYTEGRWLFVDVESAGDVEDVKTLLDLKVRPARPQK
jgi:hypothetical protein